MEHNYRHVFALRVDGMSDAVEFQMFHELEDISEVTDSFAKYVARQEDDFLPLGPAAAVRASRIFHIAHVRSQKAG